MYKFEANKNLLWLRFDTLIRFQRLSKVVFDDLERQRMQFTIVDQSRAICTVIQQLEEIAISDRVILNEGKMILGSLKRK